MRLPTAFLLAATAGRVWAKNATVSQGNGTVHASLPTGDSVTVYLHGATITSWQTSDGDERLFLSSASALNGSAAIRGGIPVVFPNFGSAVANSSADGLPSHGFARNSTWTYAGSEEREEGAGVSLLFRLGSEDLIAKYRDVWPYQVDLTYNVTLETDGLVANFNVDNVGEGDLDFQFLLHSYLSTPVSSSPGSRLPHLLTYNHRT